MNAFRKTLGWMLIPPAMALFAAGLLGLWISDRLLRRGGAERLVEERIVTR